MGVGPCPAASKSVEGFSKKELLSKFLSITKASTARNRRGQVADQCFA